jgi:hypothetical protein
MREGCTESATPAVPNCRAERFFVRRPPFRDPMAMRGGWRGQGERKAAAAAIERSKWSQLSNTSSRR